MRSLFFIAVMFLWFSHAAAIDKGLQIFRVGTGPSAGSSYFAGIKLAGFISKPAGSISCEQSGLCGVPGLIAFTQTQNGFIDAINSLRAGSLEALLMPANIAYSAYAGEDLYTAYAPYPELRVIASLQPQFLHILVRTDKGIESLPDLRGKNISIGWAQSEVPSLAQSVLGLHDIALTDVNGVLWDANDSLDAIASGELDAAFLMEAAGADNIKQALAHEHVELLTLSGTDLVSLQILSPYIETTAIPTNAYDNTVPIATVSVDLLWITHRDTDPQLIEKITYALWNDTRSRPLLKWGHLSKQQRALLRLSQGEVKGIPLHDGTRNYFSKVLRLQGEEE